MKQNPDPGTYNLREAFSSVGDGCKVVISVLMGTIQDVAWEHVRKALASNGMMGGVLPE